MKISNRVKTVLCCVCLGIGFGIAISPLFYTPTNPNTDITDLKDLLTWFFAMIFTLFGSGAFFVTALLLYMSKE